MKGSFWWSSQGVQILLWLWVDRLNFLKRIFVNCYRWDRQRVVINWLWNRLACEHWVESLERKFSSLPLDFNSWHIISGMMTAESAYSLLISLFFFRTQSIPIVFQYKWKVKWFLLLLLAFVLRQYVGLVGYLLKLWVYLSLSLQIFF
jgi:hypothetical protein